MDVKHEPESGDRRALVLVTGLALLALVAAGCGGSKSPAVASLATTTSGATTSTSGAGTKASPNAFAACMSSHGFAPFLGSAADAGSRTLSVYGVHFNGVDPSSSQFQSAMKACSRFLPGGGPASLTPAQQAEHAKAMASFAACMRRNGVPNFPDPNGQGMFSPAGLEQLSPSSPLFQRAYKACRSLMPKFGPRLQFG